MKHKQQSKNKERSFEMNGGYYINGVPYMECKITGDPVRNVSVEATSVIGSRGYLSGLNLVGLKRRSFKKEEIKILRNVYRLLFAPEGTFNERLSEVS